MIVNLDISILLDNLYYRGSPPRKITISQPLAEYLLSLPVHDVLYHIEFENNNYELWPLDEWKLYDSLGRVWTVFWDKYHEKREFLELTPRQQEKRRKQTEKERREQELEQELQKATLAGDTQKANLIQMVLIMSKTKI